MFTCKLGHGVHPLPLQLQMASKKNPTRIGFSCGDPNGIGIETLIQVFADSRMFREATPVLYATQNLVESAVELVPDATNCNGRLSKARKRRRTIN